MQDEFYEKFVAMVAEAPLSPVKVIDIHGVRHRIGDLVAVVIGTTGSYSAKDLENQVLLLYWAGLAPHEPMRGVAAQLAASVGERDLAPFDDVERWREAISLAKGLAVHAHLCAEPDNLTRRLRSKIVARAKVLAWLRERNIDAVAQKGDVFVDEATLRKLCGQADESVATLGGLLVISNLLQAFDEPFFNMKMGRFLIGRRTSTMPTEQPLGVPVGYLMALAVKYPYGPQKLLEPQLVDRIWRELVETVQIVGAIYDVEPHSAWEIMYPGGMDIVKEVSKIALYDAVFTFTQWRPSDVRKILIGLFDWVDDNFELNPEDFSVISDHLLGKAHRTLPTVFGLRDISAALPQFGEAKVRRLLAELTHHGRVNESFILPHEQSAIDFWKRPLMRLPGERFLLVNGPWCAPSFYEATAAYYRQFDKYTDEKVGASIETFVIAELRNRSLTVASGEYCVAGENGECDGVVETPEVVFLLEAKKKPLTWAAKSGDPIEIIVDLSAGLVKAHVQLGEHEARLKEQGYLELRGEADAPCRVVLNGRQVERIAVTLNDYGGFQDRVFLNSFLRSVAGATVSTTAKHNRDLKKLHKILRELAVVYERVAEQDDRPWDRFFNCWFISIGQLLILLDDVHDPTTFKDVMWRARHIAFGSMDFYWEYHQASVMHSRS